MHINTPIIIAGSGRSGTTWVQDSLASANHLRTLFEPLHPIGVSTAKPFAYRYISAYASEPELKKFMDSVFYGKKHSIWADYRIRPDRFNVFRYGLSTSLLNIRKFLIHYQRYRGHNYKGLVVKFIRANLLLPWLMKQYQFPTVLIVRHPCAVVASRLKLPSADWGADKSLSHYSGDEGVCNLIGNQFGIDLAEPMSAVAALACVWCIENILPMEWAPESGYSVVTYEQLLINPEIEWKRLVRKLGLSVVPSRDLSERPSQQAAAGMRNRMFSSKHLDKWRHELTSGDIDAIEGILERFKCTYYSVNSGVPLNTSFQGEN